LKHQRILYSLAVHSLANFGLGKGKGMFGREMGTGRMMDQNHPNILQKHDNLNR
jgi:hypothetical protein